MLKLYKMINTKEHKDFNKGIQSPEFNSVTLMTLCNFVFKKNKYDKKIINFSPFVYYCCN